VPVALGCMVVFERTAVGAVIVRLLIAVLYEVSVNWISYAAGWKFGTVNVPEIAPVVEAVIVPRLLPRTLIVTVELGTKPEPVTPTTWPLAADVLASVTDGADEVTWKVARPLNTAQSFVPVTAYVPAANAGITKVVVVAVGYAAAVGELDANPVAVTPPT